MSEGVIMVTEYVGSVKRGLFGYCFWQRSKTAEQKRCQSSSFSSPPEFQSRKTLRQTKLIIRQL